MAYDIGEGDVFEVRMWGVMHGQRVLNTFHYRSLANQADAGGAIAAYLGNFETRVWDLIRGGLSNELIDVYFEGQWVWPIRYRAKYTIPANRAGSQAFNALPTSMAVVVGRYGELAQRSNQGRIYLVGIPNTVEDNSRVTAGWHAAHAGNFATAVSNSLNPAAKAELKAIVFNIKFPARQSDVVDTYVDTTLRNQRRRQLGRGV